MGNDENTDNNDKNIEPVPYFIHEGIMSRLAECNKKLLIALIVAVVALLINNIVWVVYEGVVHGNTHDAHGNERGIVYEQTSDS